MTTPALTDNDLVTPYVECVLFAVTTNCNLRCTYCAVSLPTYRGEDFDFSAADRLAADFAAAKVHLVQISGHGETTMLPDWEAFCEAFYRHDIAVCITSNFSKVFSDAEVDALAKMTHITVSIDTVDRELLKALRRKVDLRTILYNMQLVRLRSAHYGREVKFNWQCTLSDAVVSGLSAWLDLGTLYGVRIFTLGNLLEHPALPDTPRHVAKLDRPDLLLACRELFDVSRRAKEAALTFVVQPGIVEGINERLRGFGINEPLLLETIG